jgi:DNA-binding MarR family transcriptional regulator
MKLHPECPLTTLGTLLTRFLTEMHRYDGGRTLPIMHAANVTMPQLAVLEFTRTPRTVSAIAVYAGLSRPATSQMLDKLVRRRLIRRSESAQDRRQKMIALTATGEHLLDRIAVARAERFEASLSVLPDDVARRLERTLGAVNAALHDGHLPTATVVEDE